MTAASVPGPLLKFKCSAVMVHPCAVLVPVEVGEGEFSIGAAVIVAAGSGSCELMPSMKQAREKKQDSISKIKFFFMTSPRAAPKSFVWVSFFLV